MCNNITEELEKLLKGTPANINHGLDLGTYCSLWAYKEKEKDPKIAEYHGSSKGGIRSLFWRTENGNEYIGDQVTERDGLIEDPKGVCSAIKMKLNSKTINLNNHTYTPEEIMTNLISRVVEVSKEALDSTYIDTDFDHLVVGVPAKFTAAERGTVRELLKKVTECENIRLVPEPILAALTNSYFSRNKETKRNTLVYDLGAGTFDVCMLKPNTDITVMNPYPYIVTASDGLRIAGNRFDELMEELILDKARINPQALNLSTLENKDHFDRRSLRETARETKENLSSRTTADAIVKCMGGGLGMFQISREEFEKAICAEISETVDLAYKVMKDSNIGDTPDMNIVLVGGSSYIPLVKKMIQDKFNWLSEQNISLKLPEKAVALGASIFSEMPQIVNNTPMPYHYAVALTNPKTNHKYLQVVIPRGSILPFNRTITTYHTLHEGDSVALQVYEVDDSSDKTTYELNEGKKTEYEIRHYFGRTLPKETPFDFTIDLTEDGILTMEIDDRGKSEKRKTTCTVNISNL